MSLASVVSVMSFALVTMNVAPSALAKTYERCELANELLRHEGFTADLVPTFVCIAEKMSKLESEKRGRLDVASGTRTYGIFQISSKIWCCPSLDCDRDASFCKANSANLCRVACEALVYDMNEVAKCVRTIYKQTAREKGDGFKAWGVKYTDHCKQTPQEYIDCVPQTVRRPTAGRMEQ